MRRAPGLPIVLAVVSAVVVGACSFGAYSGDVPAGPTATIDAGPVQTPSDLPCDVANFLAADCLLCHGPVPRNGAPNRLDNLAALQASSYSQPAKSNAALALERIQSTSSPMPPVPYSRATTTQIATFSAWVTGGMAAGSCTAPVDAGSPPISDAGVPATDGGVPTDLPCGVAQTLGTYCTACHSSPPTNGAPFALNSRTALQSMSPTYAGQTLAQRALARMQSTASPMPPAPYAGVPAAAVSEFSTWVSSNMPAGSCTAPVDGGTPPIGDGGVDAGPSDAGLAGDLPCDVASVLSGVCTSCHGNPPTGGAPMPLTSLAQLHLASPSNSAITNGQACVQRMASSTSPMPPSPAAPVPASQQNAFSAWVSAGMPAGSCGVDAGTPDPVFSGPPTCTSNTYWTRGDEGSSSMHPGLACIACHQTRGGEAPSFSIAGTAFPTGHELDNCYGSAARNAVVTVTDALSASRSFTVNSAGNFYGQAGGGWPVFPIRATITFNGKTRAMGGAVNSGDCNTCHTVQGSSGAPGRIALP